MLVTDRCKIGWIIEREDRNNLLVFSICTGRIQEIKDDTEIEKQKKEIMNYKSLKSIPYTSLIRIPSEKIVLHKTKCKTLYADTSGHIKLLDNCLLVQYNEMNNLGNIDSELEVEVDLLIEILDRGLLIDKYSNGIYELDNSVYRIAIKNLMTLKDDYDKCLMELDNLYLEDYLYTQIITDLVIPFNNTLQLLELLIKDKSNYNEAIYSNLVNFARKIRTLINIWIHKVDLREEIKGISRNNIKDILNMQESAISNKIDELEYLVYDLEKR